MSTHKCLNCKMIDCGCGCISTRKEVAIIDAHALLKKIESDQDTSVVVNILDENQYDECHIAGSINAPFDKLESIAADWDKNQKIVIYGVDYDSPVSAAAFKMLKKMGFAHVLTYKGGMKEWREKGFPVEGSYA